MLVVLLVCNSQQHGNFIIFSNQTYFCFLCFHSLKYILYYIKGHFVLIICILDAQIIHQLVVISGHICYSAVKNK